jgi:chromosome segregation ATPase
MSTAVDKFQELETRIVRAVDLVKTTREELAGARTHISKLERELDELRRERDLVKNRIETLLETLSELTEDEGVKAEVAIHRR